MKKLAGMSALVGAGYVVFAVMSDTRQEMLDEGILLYIASVYTLSVAIMLIHTRKWSTIGCALLATMTGDAILYLRLAHIPYPDGQWPLDLARSCFIVGGTYLLIGLIQWVREQRSGEEPSLVDQPS